MYTQLLYCVYWCVVGGEHELGMYADGGGGGRGSYSCVCLGVYTSVGGENVNWCVGQVI